MKKYLSTLHGKLVLIIVTATVPTLLFAFVALGYLFHFAKQHAQEVLSYKSYFAKESTKEILFFYEEEMMMLSNLLHNNNFEKNLSRVFSQAELLMKNSDRLENILFFDEDNKMLLQVKPMTIDLHSITMYDVDSFTNKYQLQVGNTFVVDDMVLLPLAIQMYDAWNMPYTVIFLLNWAFVVNQMQFKGDFAASNRFIEMRKTYYHLIYVSGEYAYVDILAESERIFDLADRSNFLPHLGAYKIRASDSVKYLVSDEIIYRNEDGMIVLSVSQIDYPWYHHFWYIVYIFGIMLIFITLIASLFGYFILKQVMLRDIEGILSTVDEVGKGNFVARASVADEESLGILASGINNMVEHLANKTSKLIHVAHTDELTKIYNRRYFLEEANKYIDNKGLGSIIFFDIDYFKKFNDTYGHAIGDEVLVRLAKIIDDHIRKSDIFARYGGEEFIILLKDSKGRVAVDVAEHLRNIVHDYEFHLPPHPTFHISISLGVASNENHDKELTLQSMIMDADMALYQAKENGRNQVVLFGDFDLQKVSAVVEAYYGKEEKKK